MASGIGIAGKTGRMTGVGNAAGAYTGCHGSGKPVSHRRRLKRR
jgi:hypothetical protein